MCAGMGVKIIASFVKSFMSDTNSCDRKWKTCNSSAGSVT